MANDFADQRSLSHSAGLHLHSKPGCFVVFFGLLFVVAGVTSYFLILIPLWQVYQTSGWVKIPCTIVSSHVASHRGDNGRATYSVAIEYDYTYREQSYRGDRYSCMVGASGGREEKEQVVRQYPPGSQQDCFVNPANPRESMLNRDFVDEMSYGLLPLVFALVGLIGMGLSIRTWLMPSSDKFELPGEIRPNMDWRAGSQISRDLSSTAHDLENFAPDGFVTLSSSKSGLFGCGVILLFGAIWNSAVGFMLREVIASFQRGRPEWFLCFFSIPFVLIGLLMLYALVYSLLALFNPRPVVGVRPGKIPLGEIMTLRWRFTGQATSIRQLKIELIGKEKATYSRGTRTYSDEEIFATRTILDSTSPLEISSGEMPWTLPADSMHSFKSEHNEIIWAIRFEGDIAWWPNINETYPIQVEPRTA